MSRTHREASDAFILIVLDVAATPSVHGTSYRTEGRTAIDRAVASDTHSTRGTTNGCWRFGIGFNVICSSRGCRYQNERFLARDEDRFV